MNLEKNFEKRKKTDLKENLNKEQENNQVFNSINNILNFTDILINKTKNYDLKNWLKIRQELDKLKDVYYKRLWRVRSFFVFSDLVQELEKVKEEDLINIRKRNLINDATLNILKQIEKKLFLLERKENLTEIDCEIIEILKQAKIEILKNIEEKYDLKKQKVLLNLIYYYQNLINKLNNILVQIEEDAWLKREFEKIKLEEKEKIEEFFALIKENLTSVQAKNNFSFSTMANYLDDFFFKEFLIGNKNKEKIDKKFIKEKILDYYNDDPDNKEKYSIEQNFYNKLRKRITQLILENKIEHEWEIIPSEMKSDGLDYLKSFNLIANERVLNFLSNLAFKNNNEKAKNLLKKCEDVIFESKALLRLFKKFNKDGTLTYIWQVFQDKRKNEEKEKEKLIINQKELLAEKIKKDNQLREILEQDNSVPVFYHRKYKKDDKVETITEIGAVSFILKELEDKTKVWQVKDFYNVRGLKKGDESDYEMNNFPVWVKNAALVNGLIKIEKNDKET